MRTVANPAVLALLVDRLAAVTPSAQRRWGSMDAQQMLSHLGDGAESVLGLRPFAGSGRSPSRVMKVMALWVPIRWPRGVRAGADPAAKQVSPADFEADRERAVRTLLQVAESPPERLAPWHPLFGDMRRDDWLRWAFLHTDHHLRQFGA